MRKTPGLFRLFLAFAALLSLTLVNHPALADKNEALLKKMASLNDTHRELFASGEYTKLDAEMNKIQLEYEKGKWTDIELWTLFADPFNVSDVAFEDFFTKWVEAYPKSYAAHYERGSYYLRRVLGYAEKPGPAEQKRLTLASFKDHDASLSLAAKPLLTYGKLMVLYMIAKDRDDAGKELDRAIKLEPRGALVREQYMTMLNAMGSLAEMQALAADTRKTGRDEDDISRAIVQFYARLFREHRYKDLDREMNQAQEKYEAGEMSDETLEGYFNIFASTDAKVGEDLNAWVKTYPNSYAARQAHCAYFESVGYAARGDKFIKDTSTKELQGMALYMKQAEDECKAAEALTKKPVLSYKSLMSIALAGGGHETRKQMLDLANIADPKNIIVREEFMFGLQPNWGGSLHQMKEFLEQTKQEGVSEHGQARLNSVILTVLRCNTCTGLKDFAKIGTVVTGF